MLGPWIDRLVLATINQSLPEQQLDGFVLFFTLVEGDCSNKKHLQQDATYRCTVVGVSGIRTFEAVHKRTPSR